MNELLAMGAAGVVITTGLAAGARMAWRAVRRVSTFLDQWEGPPTIPERLAAIEDELGIGQ